ncbi:MAG TPA: DUF3140 domain-containing protein [Pilimelia sp.]|nr:DUF3140 domain-containing protein [Pilimelia sp.]
MSRSVDVVVDRLWEEFHAAVNMNSTQLRHHLLAAAAGADGTFPDDPDMGIDPEGRQVLAILGKRKVDLTPNDVDVMERVVEEVSNLLVARPPDGAGDEQWRDDLMSLGHDPLRVDSPALDG